MYTATTAIKEPVRAAATMPPPTLGRVADKWLEHLKGTVKDSTWSNYAAIIRKYIPPELALTPVTRVSAEDIDSLLRRAAQPLGRKGLSASRLSCISTVMKAIFDYAVTLGLCEQRYRPGRRMRAGTRRDAASPLNNEEQHILEQQLLAEGGPVCTGILLCLYTGLRIGELCAMRWGDVSIAERTVHVRRTVQRIRVLDAGPCEPRIRLVFGEPKSASSRRDVPIPEFLAGLLQPLEAEPEAYLLTGSAERFMEPRTIKNRFRSVLDSAGLRRVNFHVLRHTLATNCVSLGCDAKALSELLGHADVGMTMNTYVHPSVSVKRLLIERLGSQFSVGIAR